MYLFETADWCPSNYTHPIIIDAPSDTDAIRIIEAGMDADTFARLRETTANNAWEDHRTIQGWNITGSTGTYQARLIKA